MNSNGIALKDEQPYFLTCTTFRWTPIFGRPEAAQIVLDSLRFLQEQRRLTIYGYVILENHLHLIASSTDLIKELGVFKSFTARKIIDYLKEKGISIILKQLKCHKTRFRHGKEYQFWHTDKQPQLIQDKDMMMQKLEQIHHNPVKRGYVDDPIHWRYSSARNYAWQNGLLDVYTGWLIGKIRRD